MPCKKRMTFTRALRIAEKEYPYATKTRQRMIAKGIMKKGRK